MSTSGPAKILPSNNNSIGTFLKWTFYLSGLGLIVYIILMLINSFIVPILGTPSVNGTTLNMEGDLDYKTAFIDDYARSDTAANLISLLPALKSSQITIAFDIYIQGTFQGTTKSPIVLTYRSDAYENLDLENSASFSDQQLDLASTFTKTNFIVYLDPITNDLYAAVVTSSGIKISKPIKNTPLRTAFRMTFTIDEYAMEIYFNGKLKETLVWKESLRDSTNMDFWTFGDAFTGSVYIATMIVWNRILRPKEIQANGLPMNYIPFSKIT